jgi:hypothetical protein
MIIKTRILLYLCSLLVSYRHNLRKYLTFEATVLLYTKNTLFRVVTPSFLIKIYRRFKGSICNDSENKRRKFFSRRNYKKQERLEM